MASDLCIKNGSNGARTHDLSRVRRTLIPAELCFHVDYYITLRGKYNRYFESGAAVRGARAAALRGKIKNPVTTWVTGSVRKKRLELSQDKLPLEPESSASAIPPLPLDK